VFLPVRAVVAALVLLFLRVGPMTSSGRRGLAVVVLGTCQEGGGDQHHRDEPHRLRLHALHDTRHSRDCRSDLQGRELSSSQRSPIARRFLGARFLARPRGVPRGPRGAADAVRRAATNLHTSTLVWLHRVFDVELGGRAWVEVADDQSLCLVRPLGPSMSLPVRPSSVPGIGSALGPPTEGGSSWILTASQAV
jgi:hypothetical protein